ncbi:MAG: ABC transporter permease subunit [Burkholderiaceae bacterium]|nr:ABC transporter permease subunit [Burkholderiaceae bacterium]
MKALQHFFSPVKAKDIFRSGLALSPALIFLALVFIVPLLLLLSRSFISPGGDFTSVNFYRLIESASYVKSLWLTVKIAGLTALLCVLIGYPLAYLIANSRQSTATTLLLCVLLPYWAGVLVRTFAWVVILSRNGPANKILQSMGAIDQPLQLIYNYSGVMLGMVNAFTPLAVILMVATMQSIDQRLLQAASSLGSGEGQSFWRVYFPLSLPGVLSSLLIIFIVSLGTFITPGLLGSGSDVMIAQVMIEQVEQLLNWGFAGAIGILILASTLLLLFIVTKAFGIQALSGRANHPSSNQKPSRLAPAYLWLLDKLGHWTDQVLRVFSFGSARRMKAHNRPSGFLKGGALLILLFLMAPALFLVPVSFTGGEFLEWPPQGLSFRWYEAVFTSDTWIRAASRSMYVGILAAAIAVLLTLPAALALSGQNFYGKRLVMGLMLAPMIVPHILIAIALLLVLSPLGLVGNDAALVMGHAMICLPYTLVALMATLKNYDRNLDLAANTLGAGSFQRLSRITIPLIKPGLLAGFLIAFITSFEELTIAMFITGGLSATLPKQLWSEMLMVASPALAAVSTLMLGFIAILVILIHNVRSKRT